MSGWVQVVLAVAAVLAALTVIAATVRKLWKVNKAAVALFANLAVLPQFMADTKKSVDYIEGQLKNNGGSTVKDAAQTTARLAQETSDRVAELAKQVKTTNTKVDRASRLAGEAKELAAASQFIILKHLVSADDQRAHLREDLEATGPHPAARKRTEKENQ